MTTTQYCEYPAAVHLRELPQVENKIQLSLAGYVFVHVFPFLTSFVLDSDLIKFWFEKIFFFLAYLLIDTVPRVPDMW